MIRCRGSRQAGPRREEVTQIPEKRTHGLHGSFQEDRKEGTRGRKELGCGIYLINKQTNKKKSSPPGTKATQTHLPPPTSKRSLQVQDAYPSAAVSATQQVHWVVFNFGGTAKSAKGVL